MNSPSIRFKMMSRPKSQQWAKNDQEEIVVLKFFSYLAFSNLTCYANRESLEDIKEWKNRKEYSRVKGNEIKCKYGTF